MKYRLLRNLPNCLRGRTLEPVRFGASFCVALTDQERLVGSVTQYSWPKEDMADNPTWFEEIKEDEHPDIESVWRHQSNPAIHPLTCGKDSRHKILVPVEVEGQVVLTCEDCAYEQKYNLK